MGDVAVLRLGSSLAVLVLREGGRRGAAIGVG